MGGIQRPPGGILNAAQRGLWRLRCHDGLQRIVVLYRVFNLESLTPPRHTPTHPPNPPQRHEVSTDLNKCCLEGFLPVCARERIPIRLHTQMKPGNGDRGAPRGLIAPPFISTGSWRPRGEASSPDGAQFPLIRDVKPLLRVVPHLHVSEGSAGFAVLQPHWRLTDARCSLFHYPAAAFVRQPRIKPALQQKVLLGTPGFRIGKR